MIAVGVPIAREVHPAFMRSLLDLDLPRPYALLDVIGRPVEDARNLITADALNDPEVTHILWIDDDAVFPPDAAKRLLAHDLPIVGGLCHGRRHPYPPILLHRAEASIGYRYQYTYPQGLVPVDATGCHFLLTRRDVYEAVHKRLRPGEGPFTQRGFGEDVSFMQRATEAGFQVFVDTTLEIGHVGEVVIDSDFAQHNRECLVNPWPPEA